MRVLLFFDLPVETASDRRNYRKFRKKLIEMGFIMEQLSVYSKLALNQSAADSIIKSVKTICPKEGTVQLLTITEKQYSEIEYLVGKKNSKTINNDERLLIL